MDDETTRRDLRAEFGGAAERAFGADRAAALSASLDRLAAAIAAVRAYPLADGVEPAILPVRPEAVAVKDVLA